jgi:hypothetical protein
MWWRKASTLWPTAKGIVVSEGVKHHLRGTAKLINLTFNHFNLNYMGNLNQHFAMMGGV